MSLSAPIRVLCNGAEDDDPFCTVPKKRSRLEYREHESVPPNVRIALPRFVRSVFHLPPRLLDLLEIAAYVFCADRMEHRGPTDAVEYHAWSRSWEFVIRVRDHAFWTSSAAGTRMAEALEFMTGDRRYRFSFQPGHETPPTSLFDDADVEVSDSPGMAIALFSGGLDSLAGALTVLKDTDRHVCLVSHRSQAGVMTTQNGLVSALKERFRGRVEHYQFGCSLRDARAPDESQRTRAFLFASIAYSIAARFGTREFIAFENGVTSLNFARRQDAINARTSRTTHPKTLGLLERLFREFGDTPVRVAAPFADCTKADVVRIIRKSGHQDLLPSSVSCSKTFRAGGGATHCGVCFQCVDRQLAMYATSSEGIDHTGLYSGDFIRDPREGESRTVLVDYVRQARNFSAWNVDAFQDELMTELLEATEFQRAGESDEQAVERIWSLCRRHGQEIRTAIKRIRERADDPYDPLPPNSLLHLLAEREHLKEPVERLVSSVCERLSTAIPMMFAKGRRPKDENDLNQKISALLESDRGKWISEHPAVSWACARVIPDHELLGKNLLIESKYIREHTPPSKATDGIAADLTKYPERAHILFVVYDPDGAIPMAARFGAEIEAKGRCTVLVT
jgi:7-cyano-7-deazaguanine synthase in queuosine biosynthesis